MLSGEDAYAQFFRVSCVRKEGKGFRHHRIAIQ